MEEYASNSHKSRQERKAELPEKKPEKVVTGEVVTRKKSGVRKFADSLISCGVENVRDYIFDEIVAPKVKDMIYGVAEKLCDGLKDGISDILYGKDTYDSDYPHYHAYYGDKRNARTVSYRSPDSYEDLKFANRGDAERTLQELRSLINSPNRVASIADLYSFVGEVGDPCDNDYGWTDLRDAKVIRVHNGYKLKLPKAIYLD